MCCNCRIALTTTGRVETPSETKFSSRMGAGADPGFFIGGGAPLRNGVTNTNKPHFFLQNTSCIRKP